MDTNEDLEQTTKDYINYLEDTLLDYAGQILAMQEALDYMQIEPYY